MKDWSRLKRAAVISVVGLFGLAGLGALADSQQNNVSPPTTPTPNPTSVQGTETETEPPAEPTPAPTPTPPPTVTPSPTPKPSSEPSNDCDPNYSPCIPNVSYDLDCADVGMQVSVIGIDRHRLDADDDGVGCDSY